jgi:hypothetical protein
MLYVRCFYKRRWISYRTRLGPGSYSFKAFFFNFEVIIAMYMCFLGMGISHSSRAGIPPVVGEGYLAPPPPTEVVVPLQVVQLEHIDLLRLSSVAVFEREIRVSGVPAQYSPCTQSSKATNPSRSYPRYLLVIQIRYTTR